MCIRDRQQSAPEDDTEYPKDRRTVTVEVASAKLWCGPQRLLTPPYLYDQETGELALCPVILGDPYVTQPGDVMDVFMKPHCKVDAGHGNSTSGDNSTTTTDEQEQQRQSFSFVPTRHCTVTHSTSNDPLRRGLPLEIVSFLACTHWRFHPM